MHKAISENKIKKQRPIMFAQYSFENSIKMKKNIQATHKATCIKINNQTAYCTSDTKSSDKLACKFS